MKPIRSAALAAAMMVALHASVAATLPSSISPDELVRLHVAVASLMTHPTSDALATIQEIGRLMIARLQTAAPVSSGPAARN
jgi:hypothetical protein